jgi:PII-like signaling protein
MVGVLGGFTTFVDAEEKIQSVPPVLDGMAREGLVAVEKPTVIFHRAGEAPAEP